MFIVKTTIRTNVGHVFYYDGVGAWTVDIAAAQRYASEVEARADLAGSASAYARYVAAHQVIEA